MDEKRKPFRTLVELPNGDQAEIRKLTVFDFAKRGQIPELLEPDPGAEPNPEVDTEGLANVVFLVTRGVTVYRWRVQEDPPEFQNFRIVSKDPADVVDGEISVVDVPEDNLNELVNAISAAGRTPNTGKFPGGDGSRGADSIDGEVPGDEAGSGAGHGPGDVQPQQEDPGAV